MLSEKLTRNTRVARLDNHMRHKITRRRNSRQKCAVHQQIQATFKRACSKIRAGALHMKDRFFPLHSLQQLLSSDEV